MVWTTYLTPVVCSNGSRVRIATAGRPLRLILALALIGAVITVSTLAMVT